MKLITDKRRAECEAIRQTFVPQPPVWSEKDGVFTGDFGDYIAWTYEREDSHGRYVYWEVARKIVNEFFGRGRLHVRYSYDAESIQSACIECTHTVEAARLCEMFRALHKWLLE